ncbi:SAM-dependent methyltransferase [Streptomyces lonarensis]|uniref:SAM-dependent methyltransferase n=1 Tax=Streptomyces lonarensis TaxID=700599 RepID=A0A7X6CY42_9ACTN|nr:SAM-dependent methyltransferase [Streptomyces lonarensis]
MTHHDSRHVGRRGTTPTARARDWAEIQERMFVPLYDAVYRDVGVGAGTRLLGLGCGSGLALLRAAALGAEVTGTDTDTDLLGMARQRLLPAPEQGGRRWPAHLVPGMVPEEGLAPFTLVTAFGGASDPEVLRRASALAAPGSRVVVAGAGDPGSFAATITARLTGRSAGAPPEPDPAGAVPPAGEVRGHDAVAARRLLTTVLAAGLRSPRVAIVDCPFGYPGVEGALRGLLASGAFDTAIATAGADQVVKELVEAVRPHVRSDGAVWLPHPLPYIVAEV